MPDTAQRIEWVHESEWVIAPQQDRSRRSLKRILEAAVELFVERGFDGTTLVDIAERAELSIGSIYRRFTDKEAILYTIIESYFASRFTQFETILDPAKWKGATVREVMEFYMDVLFTAFRKDRGILRLFEARRLVDPVIYRKMIEWDEHVCNVLVTITSSCKDAAKVANITEAVPFVYMTTRRAVVLANLLEPMSPALPFPNDDDQVKQGITRMATEYLYARRG